MTSKKRSFLGALGSVLFAASIGFAAGPAAGEVQLNQPYQAAADLAMQARVTASAPVTSGGIPMGAVVSGAGLTGATAVLFDFNNNFTAQEVTGYSGSIDLLLMLLQNTGADAPTVQRYMPSDLAGIGDAQHVHNAILQQYLSSLTIYIRAYGSKVTGQNGGVSVRFDLWLWVQGSSTPLYIGAAEVPEAIMALGAMQ